MPHSSLSALSILGKIIGLTLLILVGTSGSRAQTKVSGSNGDARTYGAKCDGRNDDTAAIQAAIDSGAQSIIIPPGTCVISPQANKEIFHLPKDKALSIRGSGIGISILQVKPKSGDYTVVFGPKWGMWPGLSLADFTIDQNSGLNPITDKIKDFPRQVIATGGGRNLVIDKIEVANINSRQVIMSTSLNTTVVNSRFVSNGGGGIYHDSSTLYLAAEGAYVGGNIFESSGMNAAGAVTAIETHGGGMTITGNVIDGYENGMNITGIEAVETRGVSVTGNVIRHAYYGIQLWSGKYNAHQAGYGLNGVSVANNVVQLDQAGWQTNAATGKPMSGDAAGIFINASSDLPLRAISIIDNTIQFATTDSKLATAFNSMGIGYRDSTDRNSVDGWRIAGNLIENAPAMGIYLAAGGSSFDVSQNTILNPGTSADPQLYEAFKSGIMLANRSPIRGLVRLQGNTIVDSRSQARMPHGIYLTSRADANIVVSGDTVSVTGGDVRQFLSPIAVVSSAAVPRFEVVQWQPALDGRRLPTGRVAPGSMITDGSSGASWIAGAAPGSWQKR